MAITPDNLYCWAQDAHIQQCDKKALEETSYRATASRAYYAVFHTAKAIESIFLPSYTGPEATHQLLEKNLLSANRSNTCNLNDEEINQIKSLAYALRSIKALRVKADYKIELDFTKADCDLVMNQTTKFIHKAQSLLSLPR